ncbi:STAS domain-containing protein [Thomasclavelia sp.]|uniref:STAS domain-containing protein n=1 Tax=Thomasclavelia sp. TaxID=3025757 RepID=UPI0025FAE3F0|nr:STAS domain-containing protein [Thomasclavelia sp.]
MENKIEYKILEDKIVVYFYGELSCSYIGKYRSLLSGILDKGNGPVYFDFSKTSFIDSSGIGLVLGRYNQLQLDHRKLYLANLSKTAYKVFELAGMFELMEYVEEVKG